MENLLAKKICRQNQASNMGNCRGRHF